MNVMHAFAVVLAVFLFLLLDVLKATFFVQHTLCAPCKMVLLKEEALYFKV